MSAPSNQGVAQGLGRWDTIDKNTMSGYQTHHGIIGLVVVAVLLLWALHKFGFRFAVTAGRR